MKKLNILKWWDIDIKYLSGIDFNNIDNCINQIKKNENVDKNKHYIEIIN